MAIVADFELYPEWNEEIKGCWVLARYEDGRPSQLRLDVVVQGQSGTFTTRRPEGSRLLFDSAGGYGPERRLYG